MFKTVGHIWKPIGQTFTLVGNVFPLTRIATPTIVPPREPIPIVNITDKPVITLVYSRKTKAANKKVPNKIEPNNSWGSSSSNVPSLLIVCRLSKSSSVKFGNDHVAKIMGYEEYQIGNVTISRVYYVEGLGHNLFSVGQFCDSDLEVAFRPHTCFIRNLDGVDLLTSSRGNNLYTLSLQDMMASSPICLLFKASKTKSWLWHRRLSHLNFEAVATAYFTQNRSIIRIRHGKTPYELLHSKLPDLLFFHVFGTLCYPTNDSENLGKLQPKADIEIFIGYAPTKKAFRIYNRRTRRIVETIHVDFNELTAMASEQSSSGPTLNEMSPRTISSGLVQKSSHSTSYVPPSRNDSDLPFQPMFDELLNPPPSVVNQAPKVIAPIAEVIPLVHVDSTGSPSSTTVDQDAPSPSKSHTTTEIQSLVIPQDVRDDNMDMEVAHMGNDPLFGVPIPEVTSAQSSLTASPHSITYKEALTQSCWIEAMQEELNDFEHLEAWELVPRPDQVMVITLKWIHTISQSPRRIFINQLKYALESLKKYSFESCDPVDTLIVDKSKLDEDKEGKAVDPSHYHGMIGTLLYLTASRPDLQFAICMCARDRRLDLSASFSIPTNLE
nr:integrase, catalytic region, zinc finger, CCHC-type, peptidase aspartic, catalytic [Tanacetum cinerariifolium]